MTAPQKPWEASEVPVAGSLIARGVGSGFVVYVVVVTDVGVLVV